MASAAIESGVAGEDSEIVLDTNEAVFGGIALFASEGEAQELEGDGMPAAPEWIELIPAPRPGAALGHVETRDWRRGFMVEDPQKIVDKFNEDPIERRRKPIDWEHLGHRNWLSKRNPAAGWIMELEVRDLAIWGRVEWTPEGREDVRLKRYAYISPVVAIEWPADTEGGIDWDAIPKAVGLNDAALTNNPATYIRSLAETPLPEGDPPAAVNDTDYSAAEPAPGRLFAASRETPPHRGQLEMKITTATLTMLGLLPTASEADIEAKVLELSSAPRPDAIEKTIMAKVDAKLEEVKAAATAEAKASIEADNAKALTLVRVEALVDRAVADNKVVPAQRESMIKFGVSQGPEELATLISTFSVHGLATQAKKPVNESKTEQPTVSLTAEQALMCEQLGVTPEEYAATLAKQNRPTQTRRRAPKVVADDDDEDDD